MKKNLLFFTPLFLSLFIISYTHAQSDSLLSLLSDLSEDETYLAVLLADLQHNPLNINEADREELMLIPLLNVSLADSIINQRQRKGPFRSKAQLKKWMDADLYKLISPYLTASQKRTNSLQISQRSIYKIEKIPQIESGQYQGDALNNYTRMRYRANAHISAGLVIQKDPGEHNYMDHSNFSLQYKSRNWLLLLGDFYLQMAAGLSQNNAYGNSKSIYLSSVFRESSQWARPNLTSAESSGKFGLFIRHNVSIPLILFAFYSNAARDAQLTDSRISGFKYDGLHRSASELAAKNQFRETNYAFGGRYTFSKTLYVQTFISHYKFSKKIDRSVSLIGENQKRRQFFNFSGRQLKQASLSWLWQPGALHLSGEVSTSDRGSPGWSQSFYYSKDKLDIGLQTWYLGENFQSVDGRVFDSQDPFPQAVKGFFGGIALKPNPQNSFSAIKKYEQHIWRSYFNTMPTEKNDWLLQWDLQLEKSDFNCRYRSRSWQDFSSGQEGIQRSEWKQQTIRLQLNYEPVKGLNARTRWEYNHLKNTSDKGALFFQELFYKPNKVISLNSRITFFSSTSFDSRVYEYERDLPGTFSNIALFGNGHKLYMLLKWKMSANFKFWFKWRYLAKNEILTGGIVNTVLSRDIRMQIQMQF